MNRCKRMTVTAVALSEYRVLLGCARNGNHDECTGEEGNCTCLHAEEIMIDRMYDADKEQTTHVGLSHSPCLACAKLLYVALPRLIRVTYWTEYRKTDGIDYLRRMGIEVRRMDYETERVSGTV